MTTTILNTTPLGSGRIQPDVQRMREWSAAQPYSRPHSETFVNEKVLVVVDATKPITKYALEWALTNVMVRPGESITFLALHPPGSHGTSMSSTWQEIKVMMVLVDYCILVCRMWVSLALAEISTLYRLPLAIWHPIEWHMLDIIRLSVMLFSKCIGWGLFKQNVAVQWDVFLIEHLRVYFCERIGFQMRFFLSVQGSRA